MFCRLVKILDRFRNTYEEIQVRIRKCHAFVQKEKRLVLCSHMVTILKAHHLVTVGMKSVPVSTKYRKEYETFPNSHYQLFFEYLAAKRVVHSICTQRPYLVN